MTCVGACEEPTLGTAAADDLSSCHDGLRLTWEPASFPGAGTGAYHVYRSTLSVDDARASAPQALDLRTELFVDGDTLPGELYWYVVEAESLDFPGCGDGPLVLGSTASVELGPVEDSADLTPPAGEVGEALRATGYTAATVDFEWPTAPLPGPGERHAILRSDGRAEGPFAEAARTPDQEWTDPAALPSANPVHVWYYDVRIVDACDNASRD
jgi:hypothetical protein